jgi:haloacetate dehalogenase
MREIVLDQTEVMRLLGHQRFAVVGHDRGARCAYRMALDQPGPVTRQKELMLAPGSFLAAPEPVPEALIASATDVFVNYMLDSWSERPEAFPAELRATYTRNSVILERSMPSP